MRHYAGIGSRQTPAHICEKMTDVAVTLKTAGFILRSGGADGADIAFEAGAGDAKEIFYPSAGGSHFWRALEIAEFYHPAWERCGHNARLLHTRNVYQVLGPDLVSFSEFVICWTKDGGATGGTGQAIRIARAFGIPVINMFFDDWRKVLDGTVKDV